MQARGGEVVDAHETNAPRPLAFDLDGAGDQQFSLVAASLSAGGRIVPGPVIDCGLVDFHKAGQGVVLGIDHGAAELGREQPGGLVGAEAELLAQLQGRDAVGIGRHKVGGPEPHGQRQFAAMHDGARPHRGLLGALGAFEGKGLGFQGPTPVVAAGGAVEPLRPADRGKIGRAGGLVGEAP